MSEAFKFESISDQELELEIIKLESEISEKNKKLEEMKEQHNKNRFFKFIEMSGYTINEVDKMMNKYVHSSEAGKQGKVVEFNNSETEHKEDSDPGKIFEFSAVNNTAENKESHKAENEKYPVENVNKINCCRNVMAGRNFGYHFVANNDMRKNNPKGVKAKRELIDFLNNTGMSIQKFCDISKNVVSMSYKNRSLYNYAYKNDLVPTPLLADKFMKAIDYVKKVI